MNDTMDTGMLWYDDDRQRTLEEKVRRAADYYRHKYGQTHFCHSRLRVKCKRDL